MSNWHLCGSCGAEFLNYNRPPLINGAPACERCDNATRAGVDRATDLAYPGLKTFLADRAAATVTITRAPLRHAPGRRGAPWVYYYSTDGARPVEYGTHLASLRSHLRRKYDNPAIIEAWKA